jgi:integrase
MAYVRRLPSGKFQATVYLPDGRRRSWSDPLKSAVKAWARDQETRISRGEWADPRTQRVLFEDWRKRWWEARVVEAETRRGDLATLKHIDPHFKGRPLPSITRMDVQGWVRQLEKDGVGAHAIRRAYNLLTTMLGAAVLEGIIATSPCRRIDRPATPPKAPAWFTVDQVRDLLAAFGRLECPRHAAAVALMCWTGLRWGEMAGLRISDVDFDRSRVKVVGARTQRGEWKDYPKSSKSRREVPVPGPVLAALRDLARQRPPSAPLFTTVRGERPLSAANWRRVWDEAVELAGVPKYSPHTCRHTAASWLVQAGVDLYRVQALLGHESFATTQRYAHLAPDAHGEVEQAWAQVQAIEGRQSA